MHKLTNIFSLVISAFFAFISITVSADDIYVYPSLYEKEIPDCTPDESILNDFLSESWEAREYLENAKLVKSIDLNSDGLCEIFMLPSNALFGNSGAFLIAYSLRSGRYERLHEPFIHSRGIYIYDKHNDEYDLKENSWDLIVGVENHNFWFGDKKNGWPRIIAPGYVGHRTNPIYVTRVYYYDGKRYALEFNSGSSHGRFTELAYEAYKAKDYDVAEKWYLNAYRMHGERNIDSANDLALVYIKQGRCPEAVSLLNKHLDSLEPSELESEIVKAVHFNLSLCE